MLAKVMYVTLRQKLKESAFHYLVSQRLWDHKMSTSSVCIPEWPWKAEHFADTWLIYSMSEKLHSQKSLRFFNVFLTTAYSTDIDIWIRNTVCRNKNSEICVINSGLHNGVWNHVNPCNTLWNNDKKYYKW